MNITPSIFLTSDTHFGHQNLVNWGHRTESHNEDIVRNWNSVVGKHGVVLHLGDLTMTGKEQTKKWTDRLHGEKFLIRGNHDGQRDGWLKDCGFTVIPASYQVFTDKYGNSIQVVFSHVPLIPLFPGFFNIHGHLHGDNHRNIETSDHHYDVGVDAHDFYPIQLAEILSNFRSINA